MLRHPLPQTTRRFFHRALPLLAALLLLGGLNPAALEAQGLLSLTRAELDLERRLMAEDLRLYAASRGEVEEAASALTAALTAFDEQIDSREVSVLQLELLESRAARAQVEHEAALDGATRIRHRLVDRLRRTALLAERIEALGGDDVLRQDPISGAWDLEVDPGGVEGRLELSANGTLISGTYQLEDGSNGSVSGTYAGGRLSLERVDSRTGFDSLWTGEVDLARREISGRWIATELAAGEPTAGNWRARKIEIRGEGP
ncbi:MAG: hypothetical protein AAGD01_11765 [Acidobacteriota bacterium]